MPTRRFLLSCEGLCGESERLTGERLRSQVVHAWVFIVFCHYDVVIYRFYGRETLCLMCTFFGLRLIGVLMYRVKFFIVKVLCCFFFVFCIEFFSLFVLNLYFDAIYKYILKKKMLLVSKICFFLNTKKEITHKVKYL